MTDEELDKQVREIYEYFNEQLKTAQTGFEIQTWLDRRRTALEIVRDRYFLEK